LQSQFGGAPAHAHDTNRSLSASGQTPAPDSVSPATASSSASWESNAHAGKSSPSLPATIAAYRKVIPHGSEKTCENESSSTEYCAVSPQLACPTGSAGLIFTQPSVKICLSTARFHLFGSAPVVVGARTISFENGLSVRNTVYSSDSHGCGPWSFSAKIATLFEGPPRSNTRPSQGK
jgi:hypothetical protein